MKPAAPKAPVGIWLFTRTRADQPYPCLCRGDCTKARWPCDCKGRTDTAHLPTYCCAYVAPSTLETP